MADTTHPIVLAHGIARFDLIAKEVFDRIDALGEDLEDRLHYFRGIRSTLRADGFTVEYSDVPWAESVGRRAAVLKTNVEHVLREHDAEKVHIIAHSMGGLDARHLLFDHRGEGFHEKVSSLTTIGTPHLGTSFADWGIRNTIPLRGILALSGNDSLDGFEDLTRERCAKFDLEAEAFERGCGVRFRTYAGAQAVPFVFGPLQLPALLIEGIEGANDGLVSVRSARWRDEYFQGTFDADHLNEVGWWDDDDLGPRLFATTARRRADRREMEERIRGHYRTIARDLLREFPA